MEYTKRALKETNNETHCIRAIMTNKTMRLLKHGSGETISKELKIQYLSDTQQTELKETNSVIFGYYQAKNKKRPLYTRHWVPQNAHLRRSVRILQTTISHTNAKDQLSHIISYYAI